MKLTKAIEILDVRPGQNSFFLTPGRLEAMKLGIEALKAIKKMRHFPFPEEILQLPGETK